VIDAVGRAQDLGAQLVILPELVLTGYPPEDLLLRPAFARASREALEEIARAVPDGVVLVGFADLDGDVHNAAGVVAGGRVQAVYHKRFLPNYGVFDEARYFAPGDGQIVLEVDGLRLGIVICEDIWYPSPISGDLAAARLDLVCCLSASPYFLGKGAGRERMLRTRARDAATTLAFCNLVGGQDELVFDGRSVLIGPDGAVQARAREFEADLIVAEIDPDAASRRRLAEPLVRNVHGHAVPEPVVVTARPVADGREPAPARIEPSLADEPQLWRALRLGIADYVGKNGFPGVVVGLSGGIDSALTATLAADALGPERVTGVTMPSIFSSSDSAADAATLSESLGIRFQAIPISSAVNALEDLLAEDFAGLPRDVTEENLQARVRGTILMALSNKHGHLVLATGNKSEISVGYSTLYGDMVGGFAPLRDVSKTWVYRLARWRNAEEGRELVPARSIERPPSAELRPDQLDTDSLPPYEQLDPILEAYIEQERSVEEIVAGGAPEQLVREIVGMVDRAEYKRRQGPVGIKITPRAFGRDRRMPITTGHGE
jgi:NAD+ synthase (glutamine-hydrolysing)